MNTKKRIVSLAIMLSIVFGLFGVISNPVLSSADTGNAEKLVIGATVTGNFEKIQDHAFQYYFFETDSDRSFYSIALTYESPYDDIKPTISVSADIGGESIVKMQGKGVMDCKNLLKPNSVYYVTVDSDNPWPHGEVTYSYTLKVTKYTDDVTDAAIEAKTIVVDEVVKGNIENSADIDVFSFVAGSDKYKLTTSASENVQFFVYEDELLTTQLMSGKGTNSLDLGTLLSAGKTYYIGVKGTVIGFNAESYMFKIIKNEVSDSEVTVEIPDVGSVNISPAKKKVTLKWKKTRGASGYQINRSMKKNKGYKCIKKITRGSTVLYVDKNVKSGKVYYYKIRAFKKVGSTVKFGGWSPVKKVKVQ